MSSLPLPGALRPLSLAYFVQAVGALSVVGCLQAISREWQLSDSQSAYLLSLFGVTFALAAPLLQILLGHWARRTQVLGGLLLFSLAALLLACAADYPTLLVSRVLMGVGAGFIGPVLGALGAGLVSREQQGSAIATVLLGLSMASLVGLPLSAWVATALGVRPLFAGIGGLGLLTAWLIFHQVPDRVPGERIAPAVVARLLTTAHSLHAFLVVFFIAAGVFSTYAFLTPIVRQDFHGSVAEVSLALAVLGVAGVLGNLLVIRAARRFSAERLLLGGLLLLALALSILALGQGRFVALLLGLVVWALATDILWPSQQRRILEQLAEVRGIALALTASFMFCGIGVGTFVAGQVYPRHGFQGLLLTSLAFLLLALFSLQRSRRTATAPPLPA